MDLKIGVINFALFQQQLCHLLQHCTCNIMFTSANVVATTRKLFEQKNDNMDIMLNGKKRQVGVMVVSNQKNAKSKKLSPSDPLFGLDITH